MSFRPKNEKLWIALPKELKEKTTKAGIILTGSAADDEVILCTVKYSDHKDYKPKQKVYLSRVAAMRFKITVDGVEGLLVKADSILGVSNA